jgi:hypothetical protein
MGTATDSNKRLQPNVSESKDRAFILILQILKFLAIPLICSLISLKLGRDLNWDLKHYHYYNAYAFIAHRQDFDIAPAQLQTFFNPLGDVPFYLLTRFFPSWVAGFVLGFIHGFNLSLIFAIFWKITNFANKWRKLFCGMCVVLVSGIAPTFVAELGNTMNDNVTTLFVLGAVLLLIMASENSDKREDQPYLIYVGLAAVIMGIGVGIKPSIAIFAVSTAFVFSVLQTSWRNKAMSLFIYGVSGILGTLISAGFLWWQLWLRFGNPLFPFYNQFFKSPYFVLTPVEWSPFLPRNFWEYIAWPIMFSIQSYRTNQLQYFDIRFALLYILVMIWLSVYFAKTFRLVLLEPTGNCNLFLTRASNFLSLFFLVSYLLWMKESAAYRFIGPLELLVPCVFLILLERVVPPRKISAVLAVTAALLTLAVFKPFTWGRFSWTDKYFSVDTTHFNTSEDALVVMLGSSPTSFVIPEFPPNFRFVRPEGNLSTQSKFFTEVKDLLKGYRGVGYILYNKEEKGLDLKQSLTDLDLSIDPASSFLLKINTPDKLEMCRFVRK